MNKEDSHPHGHEHPHGPAWKRLHRDWRAGEVVQVAVHQRTTVA